MEFGFCVALGYRNLIMMLFPRHPIQLERGYSCFRKGNQPLSPTPTLPNTPDIKLLRQNEGTKLTL